MKKNEEHGPRLSFATQENPAVQPQFYQELQLYNLTEQCERGCDYFKVGSIDGIDYYAPNDEDWGAIIAISEKDQIAINTGFYEMDDMEYPGSDYKMVVADAKIGQASPYMGCKFELE